MELQFCFVVNCLKGVPVATHTHPTLELVYYVGGSGGTAIGGKAHRVRRNVLAVVPAGVPHDQTNLTDVDSICVGVSHSGLEPLEGTWNDAGGLVGKVLHALVEELKHRKTGFESVSQGLLLEAKGLTERLAREAARPAGKEVLVHKALDLIRRHDGALSVADVSDRLYVSRDYLRHLFREYAGQSPIRFILLARVEKARALLADDRLLVGEVASRCGFENIYYFSRLFRKVTGKTPSQYRKTALGG